MMQGEVISQYVTLEQVDDAILRRYLDLVENAEAEDLAKLLEAWAKYISARKNSDVFEKGETEEERAERKTKEAIQEALTS
jgi:cobyrinic acid a,c-diamide synthase